MEDFRKKRQFQVLVQLNTLTILFFILATPIFLPSCSASSSLKDACSGPLSNWDTPSDGIPHLAVINRVRFSPNNELRWNNVIITEEQLRDFLHQIRNSARPAFTIFDPDRTVDCAELRRIRELIDTSLGCVPGLCGEGRNWRPRAQ